MLHMLAYVALLGLLALLWRVERLWLEILHYRVRLEERMNVIQQAIIDLRAVPHDLLPGVNGSGSEEGDERPLDNVVLPADDHRVAPSSGTGAPGAAPGGPPPRRLTGFARRRKPAGH